MCESESLSLEYIEDPYIPKLDNLITPSLDDVNEYDDDDDDDQKRIIIDRTEDDDCDDSNNLEWSEETDKYLRSLTLDDILFDINDLNNSKNNSNNGSIDIIENDGINNENIEMDELSTSALNYESLELQTVETEFSSIGFKDDNDNNSSSSSSYRNNLQNLFNTNEINIGKRWRLKFFTRKSMREVKVTFIDFSKPYFPKISNSENFKKFLNISTHDHSPRMSEPLSPASVASADIAAEFANLTAEEQERQRAEWNQELIRVEEEINTLRTVLASKVRLASDLKRKLGITVWKEITDDMNQGIKNVKESQMFQKTESVFKSTAEKTSSILGGITSGITSKLSQIKNSESMRSIEDRVGSAYENVKTKVSTSRSSSVASFTDALNENHSTTPNSPTIPEGKPLS